MALYKKKHCAYQIDEIPILIMCKQNNLFLM